MNRASKPGALALAILLTAAAYAGGPRYVAGTSYFDPAVAGQPIVWANGLLSYYTDEGDLSPTVSHSQGNSMIAAAAAVWNAVPTAGVNISAGGSLSEDVSGANVSSSGNTLTLPADIQSGYTAKPIAIVFDEDGSIINAFFGAGASTPNVCQQNGVFTFVDNLSPSGNIVHALVIINGLCATNSTNTAVLQYQLVRAFGQILGLDWSQTNEEDFAIPQQTESDLDGWPIMHPVERLCNKTGDTCMPNGTTLRPDDIAALNRLYPVTQSNIGKFRNKKLTAANTISVTGTIRFRNGQGMQGVNVVLRPLIPGTTQPDVPIVTFFETLDAWTQPCSAEAVCPPAPLLQQETVQATSGSNGMVVLNPIGSSGRAVRLYVTAVTGTSALLNFELEQHP